MHWLAFCVTWQLGGEPHPRLSVGVGRYDTHSVPLHARAHAGGVDLRAPDRLSPLRPMAQFLTCR